MKRVLVLSDLHLAPVGDLCNFRAGAALCDLFETKADGQTRFVFAGDTFDLLQMPSCPEVLDLEGAPELLRQMIEAIKREDWGARFFRALRRIVEAGGECILMPGNHDPELFHPVAADVLCAAAEVAPGSAALRIDRSGEPLTQQVGSWEVVVGHGHRTDAFNDIDPNAVRRAIERGDRSLPLPAGSLLVLRTINAFRRALDPDSGNPRFPFVDALKPEMEGVALLLLYLDPRLFLSHAPSLASAARRALGRALRNRLRRGPTFDVAAPSAARGDDTWAAGIADALASGLSDAERAAGEAMISRVDDWLDFVPPAAAGFLSPGATGFTILRAAVRVLRSTCTFFEPQTPSSHDRKIIAEWLPDGVQHRVVVSGHTHAAREIAVDDSRMYLNTGTWTDLMQLPSAETDDVLREWIEALTSGRASHLQHLTYAEIDADGPRLSRWESSGA